jgi:aminopeptidase N
LADPNWSLDPASIGKRTMRNTALGLLSLLKDNDSIAMAEAQFNTATCMTDQLSALSCLIELGPDIARGPLDVFLDRWRSEQLVVNKWLALQAMANWDNVLDHVTALLDHPVFDWSEPNKIYSLIGGFAGNTARFHRIDGAGYEFLADQVIKLDARNPQVAARMVRALIRWKRFNSTRQVLMRTQLERINARKGLSRDVGEIVSKALD